MVQGNDILFAGSIMVDVICRMPRLPESGQGVVAESVVSRLGGCAFNSANAARQTLNALAGSVAETATEMPAPMPCVRLLAPVGEGPYGAFTTEELAARGMSAFVPADLGAAVAGSPRDTGAAMCLIEPSGERTMLTLPGIERCYTPEWFAQFEAENETGIAATGSVNMCGYEVAGEGGAAMLEFVEAHPEWEFWFAPGPMILTLPAEKLERIFARRAIWHLNEAEACAITGCVTLAEAGPALFARARNAVVVTAGAEGCYIWHCAGAPLHVATDPVKPVDTIGAGDSHLGTLMAARACGLTWGAAAALANRVSGAVCQVEGATLTDDQFAALGLRPAE